PVAYYLHNRRADDTYLTAKAEAEDRRRVKHWLIRSLIKPGIWGSALDVLLSALREVIRSDEGGALPVDPRGRPRAATTACAMRVILARRRSPVHAPARRWLRRRLPRRRLAQVSGACPSSVAVTRATPPIFHRTS